MRTISTLLLLVAGLALALPAAAQWQWRDQNDKLVFSDRPPPSDVPESRILRRPGALRPAPAAAAASVAPPPAAAVPRLAGKDKELEERRQQAEAQEEAKKAAQLQAQARARADNCARARQAKTTYDSGVRLARTDANGEREFIDDATRAAESRRLQSIIASDCS
ncbi:DUF4124 domain-containing protein [Pseudorhodoferax sp. Leaf267]|uniref:DUF4124 domain-containing protein n=1 Tax=Pseudorhodoferax sp. Leaf267 TaxID=1736316 RepID=UPI0006FF4C35|nr:DUF4124 domain-containing protein [Pseudorhodoferax sp. Leaf267]KQP14730.1 hypothetical protein ASF43_11690 [Pseudorhodoferax sp. Leaf267]